MYTIPYIVGVSPPSTSRSQSPMAGIELFLPFMKTGSTNMQMVFDKSNGLSLGALVTDTSHDKTALTSYQVDSSEGISPLGVSLKWNHVNMKSNIVRGMPYGTVRFGKDKKKKFVLPKILSGGRAKNIHIDTNTDTTVDMSKTEKESSNKMLCGTFTGESIEQDLSRAAPITSTGKPTT